MRIIFILLMLPSSVYAVECYIEIGAGLHEGLAEGQDWEDQNSLGTHYGFGCRKIYDAHEIEISGRHSSHIFVGTPIDNRKEDHLDFAGVNYRYYFWSN